MLEIRKKASPDGTNVIELKVLNAMKCNYSEFKDVPTEIQELSCGQLCVATVTKG